MDSGSHGALGAHQRLGLPRIIRPFPILLHEHLGRFPISNIMDRVGADLPCLLRRCLLRQSPWRRLLPHSPGLRIASSSAGRVCDVRINTVLATVPCARRLLLECELGPVTPRPLSTSTLANQSDIGL